MNANDIKKGDCLRVLTLDELLAKFGTDENGNVATPIPFEPRMNFMCGRTFTVSEIIKDAWGFYYRSEEDVESGKYKVRADVLSNEKEIKVAEISLQNFESILQAK